ncbi:MAG: hypothetical protein R3B96_02205 [Pirellulaceae bacterium]
MSPAIRGGMAGGERPDIAAFYLRPMIQLLPTLELVFVTLNSVGSKVEPSRGESRVLSVYIDRFPALREAADLPELVEHEITCRHAAGEEVDIAEYSGAISSGASDSRSSC